MDIRNLRMGPEPGGDPDTHNWQQEDLGGQWGQQSAAEEQEEEEEEEAEW